MAQTARKKRSAPKVDLSTVNAVGDASKFQVETYDYDELQTGKPANEIQLENDLLYLLHTPAENGDQLPSVDEGTKIAHARRSRKTKNGKAHMTVKKEEITADIDEIIFSSDDEGESESKEGKKAKGKQKSPSRGKMIKKDKSSEPTEDTSSIKIKPLKEDQTVTKVSANSSGKAEKKKKKRNKNKKTESLAKTEPIVENDRTDGADSVGDSETPGSETPEGSDVKEYNDLAEGAKESAKKKRNRGSKKSKKTKQDEMATNEEANTASGSEKTGNGALEKPTGVNDATETSDDAKAKQQQDMKRPRSSAIALSATNLPEIQPITTIIGLPFDQILHMKPTDVKIKTIQTVSNLSKTCKHVLQFTLGESEGLFKDKQKQTIFVELCINVALYESAGFNLTAKKYPDMASWLAKYEPLTLQSTKTKLTVSKKAAHTNNFDYTVFSYIGHIILWASHLQSSNGITTVLGKLNLNVTRKQIMDELGGYHLWDRIRRNPKTINTKRWKHIQKFRQNFPFEVDQFVLILRYMCLDISMPSH
ncbi:hypothetical protein EJF18_20016 [Clavispora lusitaniae]|uniref:Uncharacterized protein n=1 Tax=Clavispora lusitaniae TaxID=36911 RepID=A0ACD0WFH0_CLALS|nr:hypothetical protein FOB63_002130 [Clavispora lusitaniae]QFZ26121.1 hypothetical protein EJF14_20016 [Clavispora lusitaniae]QFZ31789.1 hypothetical protein EJF16_20016 [Clavispora lusitaniae]QFZ37458.1 hypothetical protein EJF15_20016 [Clavispora lusitaniae]QFZ43142.1 hypothetical protein EJF18_20016 [Clavispora lusitaniae]